MTRPGFPTATPYMIYSDTARAIEFCIQAFGATETFRMADDDGKVRHAEILIGNSPIMLVDEFPEHNQWRGAESYGGSPVHIYLYVDDADEMFARAIAAGATELLPMKDQPYGERSGGIVDPFGHIWYLSTYNGEV